MTSDNEKQQDPELPTALATEHYPSDEHSNEEKSLDKSDNQNAKADDEEKKGSFKDFLVSQRWITFMPTLTKI